jgi:hypothetical protein
MRLALLLLVISVCSPVDSVAVSPKRHARRHYDFVSGDCKTTSWVFKGCKKESMCMPDEKFDNPCKHKCICSTELGTEETCKCAKLVPKPPSFQQALAESGECKEYCECMADELLYGITHSLPYDVHADGYFHYKVVEKKDVLFKIEGEGRRWMIEDPTSTRKWFARSKTKGETKKWLSVSSKDPKIRKMKTENRLIAHLLDYFKPDPAKRPGSASKLEHGRNKRCNLMKKKQCKADKGCEWKGIMGVFGKDCVAVDSCMAHDGNKQACDADKRCTHGATRKDLRLVDCSLIDDSDQPHNSEKPSEDSETCYRHTKIPRCTCRKANCNLAMTKTFIKTSTIMTRINHENSLGFLDKVQFTLDLMSLLPGPFGSVFDLVNAGIYGFRKQWKEMSLALFCIVPFFGDVLKLVKSAKFMRANDVLAMMMEYIDKLIEGGFFRDMLRNIFDIVKRGMQGKLKLMVKALVSWAYQFIGIGKSVGISREAGIAFKATMKQPKAGEQEEILVDYTGDILMALTEKRCTIRRWQIGTLNFFGDIPVVLRVIPKRFRIEAFDNIILSGHFINAVGPCLIGLDKIKPEHCSGGRDAMIDAVPNLRKCLATKAEELGQRINGKFDEHQVEFKDSHSKCGLEEGTHGGECQHDVEGTCSLTAKCPVGRRRKGHCIGGKQIICCLKKKDAKALPEQPIEEKENPLSKPENSVFSEGTDMENAIDKDISAAKSNFIELQALSYRKQSKQALEDELHSAFLELIDTAIDTKMKDHQSNDRVVVGIELMQKLKAMKESRRTSL